MANELATSKDITNYLKHVFDLEKMLYQQNEILEHLRDSIGSVNYQMKLEPEIYQEKRPSVVGGIITAIACAFFAILVYFGYVFEITRRWSSRMVFKHYAWNYWYICLFCGRWNYFGCV